MLWRSKTQNTILTRKRTEGFNHQRAVAADPEDGFMLLEEAGGGCRKHEHRPLLPKAVKTNPSASSVHLCGVTGWSSPAVEGQHCVGRRGARGWMRHPRAKTTWFMSHILITHDPCVMRLPGDPQLSAREVPFNNCPGYSAFAHFHPRW